MRKGNAPPSGGLLAAAQYSDVQFLGVGGGARALLAPYEVDGCYPVVPPNFSEVVRPPKQWCQCVADQKSARISALKAAQMVLVCTDPTQTDEVAALLLEAFPRPQATKKPRKPSKKGKEAKPPEKAEAPPREPSDGDVAIVSLNPGVSAAKELWHKLDGLVTPDFISGSACFEVTYSASQKAFRLLVRGAIVLRRLSKSQKHCEKFLDLLSTTAMKLIFTHDPLHHSWGCATVISALTVPAALTSCPTACDALSSWKLRLVSAAVLLEVTDLLVEAFSTAQKNSQERRAASGDVSRRQMNREGK
eukprot:scaffold803_cov310-Pinguiococcus_pyrenoidosus.AAC.116